MPPVAIILGIVVELIPTIIKAINFVEELWGPGTGTQKFDTVMNIAQTAVEGVSKVEGADKNWAIIQPLVEQFINGVIAAANALDTAKK
jgi:hypothetical protein